MNLFTYVLLLVFSCHWTKVLGGYDSIFFFSPPWQIRPMERTRMTENGTTLMTRVWRHHRKTMWWWVIRGCLSASTSAVIIVMKVTLEGQIKVVCSWKNYNQWYYTYRLYFVQYPSMICGASGLFLTFSL